MLFKGEKMIEDLTREKIIKILRGNPEGLTIVDMAKLLRMSRTTVSKYVYGLTYENFVQQRRVGPAKLCCLKEERNEGKQR